MKSVMLYGFCLFLLFSFPAFLNAQTLLSSTENQDTTIEHKNDKRKDADLLYYSHVYLGKIVVAKRTPSNPDHIAENVVVYTQEDIQKLPARDLGEVLSYMPGIDVQLSGQFGQPTSLSVNGSSARQVLLMIDGIPFNTQLSGQANPTQMSIENIKQIELVKGAASSAWGSGLGGAINVITKDVGDSLKPKGTFTSSVGGYNTTKNSLDLAGKVSDVGYFVSGSYLDTDGVLSVTNTEESKAFAKLSYPLEGLGAVVGSFGYNGTKAFYGVTSSNRINDQRYNTRYGKLALNADEADIPYSIAYKYNDQDIATKILNGTTRAMISSVASTNLYQGLSLEGHSELFDTHLLVVGTDLDWYSIKSNQYLNSSKSISMQAPYVNYTLPYHNWDFIPGLRYDHNQQFGQQTSPSFGTVYHFQDDWESLMRTKISRAFNAPPLLWIFNNDPSQFVGPNPDLKAERSVNYEIGWETKPISSVDVKLNLYRADVKDGIALVFDSSQFVFVQRNFRKFRRQGAEALLNYQVTEALGLYGSAGFNDVENRTTRQTVRDQGIARQKFTFGTQYKTRSGFGANLSGYYNRWSSSASLRPNDRKPIFDFKLTQAFDDIRKGLDLEAFFTIHNVMNSKYWSSITYPLAERYIEGGLSIKF